MIRCGILEEPDAAMARFRGALNREFQDILDYKEYADMTQLFEFACKAEREVQGHHSRTYSNTFAGRNSSSSSAPALLVPSTPTPREKIAMPVGAAQATGAASTTGRTRDISCFRCSGRGHVTRDCPNKRTLLIRDNGEYSSASDSEELEHTLLATNNAAKTNIHVNPGDADRYESLVVQRVLSTQVAQTRRLSDTLCSIRRVLCRGGRFASSSTVAAATIWRALCWSRSCLYPLVSIPTHITFNGLMMVVKLEYHDRCVFLFL
jgi:hypothetical protein